MKKIKVKELTVEERIQVNLAGSLRDAEQKLSYGCTPLNPTRTFIVGERVFFGANSEVYVSEVYHDGLFYKIECFNVGRRRGEAPHNEFYIIEWQSLMKYVPNKQTTFKKEERYFIRQQNSSISSLLHYVYHAGVDFDVEYQRDHVWQLADKIALIDSIFNNIDIGKFVFVERSYNADTKLFEIIDGKQRLSTLCEFYEDRFQYNGYFYSELSGMDKNKIQGHSVTYGYLENPDKRAIYETFIKLNTCGKPMDSKHLDSVRELLKNLNDEQ